MEAASTRLYVAGVEASGEAEVKTKLEEVASGVKFALQRGVNGQPRNYGFAQFNTKEEASRALGVLKGLVVAGKTIRVLFDRNAMVSKLVAVHVSGLPKQVTDADLKSLFPNAESIKVVKDRVTGVSLCYGFVNFKTQSEAQEAIAKYHNSFLMKSKLKVTLKWSESEPRPPPNPRKWHTTSSQPQALAPRAGKASKDRDLLPERKATLLALADAVDTSEEELSHRAIEIPKEEGGTGTVAEVAGEESTDEEDVEDKEDKGKEHDDVDEEDEGEEGEDEEREDEEEERGHRVEPRSPSRASLPRGSRKAARKRKSVGSSDYEVYVGNLAPTVKKSDLKVLCRESKFMSRAWVYLKHGYAFVHFGEEDDAKRAVELWHKLPFHHKELKVNLKTPEVSVLVENITKCLSLHEVQDILRALPECRKFQVPTNHHGEQLGRAILFGTPAQAAQFVKFLDGRRMGELPLRAYISKNGAEELRRKIREEERVLQQLEDMKMRQLELEAERWKTKLLAQQLKNLKRTAEEKEARRMQKRMEEMKERKLRQEIAELQESYQVRELEKEIAKSKAELKKLKEKERMSEKEKAELAQREKEIEEKRRIMGEVEGLKARRALAELELDTAPVDWNATSTATGWREVENATVVKYAASVGADGAPGPMKELSRTPATIQVKHKPFGSGTFRLAYHAKVTLNGATAPLKMVVKSAIGAKGTEEDKSDCLVDAETQAVAVELAKRYSTQSELSKRLEFVEPMLLHFHERTAHGPNHPLYMVGEPVLEGKWKRFTNNSKYVAEESKFATVLAFSHYTHKITKGRMMVVDLQGVHDSTSFKLTDPAIHHSDVRKFGSSNRGGEGMGDFFEAHQCNQLCKALNLPKHPKQKLDDHVTETLVRA